MSSYFVSENISKCIMSLWDIYMTNFVSYNKNKGYSIKKNIIWNPKQVDFNTIDLNKQEIKQILNTITDTLTYKLIITYIYLSKGYTVYWDFKVNRSTNVDIYVENLCAFYIPDMNNVSYKYAKHYRKNRLQENMKQIKVYITHVNINYKYNSYWKPPSWFVKQI